MKYKRQKIANRFLNFYKNHFNFREPYQFLLDGSFCNAALENKVNVREQIPKYLSGEVKILTTVCAVQEVEKLGTPLYGAMVILKQFPVHKCGHERTPIAVNECLLSMIGKKNDSHYIIATQDFQLRKRLRKVPGTPIVYLHHNTPVLEKPSEMSESSAETNVQLRLDPSSYQKEILNGMKQQLLKNCDERRKKRKRKGGPNPLSCLKKKKQSLTQQQGQSSSKTSKRKPRFRVKIPKHVRTELSSRQSSE